MNKRVMYHKKTGAPIQLIAQANAVPGLEEVICYQELEAPFEYFVMERRLFFSTFVRSFEELPVNDRKQIEKKEDLPDKQKGRRLKRLAKKDKSGEPKAKTSHSLNPVPGIIYDPEYKGEYDNTKLNDGLGISSWPATLMNLMGYVAPTDYDKSMINLK